MERLNLYPYKKRKVRVTTFLVLLLIMCLPPLAFYTYFRFLKVQIIEDFKLKYLDVVKALSINLTVDSGRNLKETEKAMNLLQEQLKDLKRKIENLNNFLILRKENEDFLEETVKIFAAGNRYLSYLKYTKGSMELVFYEISSALEESLSISPNFSAEVVKEFDQPLPQGFYLRKYRVVLRGR